jgi:hypothetical protein
VGTPICKFARFPDLLDQGPLHGRIIRREERESNPADRCRLFGPVGQKVGEKLHRFDWGDTMSRLKTPKEHRDGVRLRLPTIFVDLFEHWVVAQAFAMLV